MPNWCENYITITGDKEKMKPIVDILRELEAKENKNKDAETLVMQSLLGTDDHPDNYEAGGWYDYNIKKFGTKWDFQLIRDCGGFEILDDSVTFDVMTAWSPPEAFLKALCEKYDVEASINFAECGMDFGGSSEFGKGGCITSTTSTYLKSKYDNGDYFWEEVENLAYSCSDEPDDDSLKNFKESLSFLPENEMEEALDIYNKMTNQEQK